MSLTENQQINAALTAARTDLAKARHQREAMAIAERRGELIEKTFVARQAQYIFITLRRAILNFPTRYARQVVGISDEHQARAILTKAAHEFLTELADFDERAIDPGWMQTLAGNGDDKAHTPGQPKIRPSTAVEIKAEMEKAKIRRRKKTETMRRLRAKGKIA